MPIDFHAERNRTSYAGRDVSPDWAEAIRALVDPEGLDVADIGCGGGLYAAEWKRLGAATVVGVDFSAQMLGAARERHRGLADVRFVQGDAGATGLPTASVDVVFSRALIHHLDDRDACFREARRILRRQGLVILQNRTAEDVALPGAPDHLRGYYFERCPRLRTVEDARRPRSEAVVAGLRKAGFGTVRSRSVWETRQVHSGFAALAADLRARTGRSILHALSDAELVDLIGFIGTRLPPDGPVTERDRWTLWWGRAEPEAAAPAA
jgi:ubiquinone/menaquinone biosynthesis C-methylase UbiE